MSPILWWIHNCNSLLQFGDYHFNAQEFYKYYYLIQVDEITHLMLFFGIYFFFFLIGVLSSPLGVAWLCTGGLGPNFGDFSLEIGKNFKQSIFFGHKCL